MTEQLTPDVRAEAAQAASDARREYDNATLYVNEAGRNLHIVDAVAAVVAPEIARPLQAQIAELIDESAALEAVFGKLEDENLRLRDQAGEMAEELELLRDATVVVQCDDPQRTERDALRARVQLLTAALTDALEGLEDMRPYVSQYFAEKWGHDGYITRARAALAAGVANE